MKLKLLIIVAASCLFGSSLTLNAQNYWGGLPLTQPGWQVCHPWLLLCNRLQWRCLRLLITQLTYISLTIH